MLFGLILGVVAILIMMVIMNDSTDFGQGGQNQAKATKVSSEVTNLVSNATFTRATNQGKLPSTLDQNTTKLVDDGIIPLDTNGTISGTETCAGTAVDGGCVLSSTVEGVGMFLEVDSGNDLLAVVVEMNTSVALDLRNSIKNTVSGLHNDVITTTYGKTLDANATQIRVWFR